MKRASCIGVVAAIVSTAVFAQGGQDGRVAPSAASGAAQTRRMVDTYCVGCHNTKSPAGNVAFDALALDQVHEHAEVWEKSTRKLRGRLMPPPGSRQPEQREIDAAVAWLESTLDEGAKRGRVAGHVPIQRLTRTEFGIAVNELLGIELDPTRLLPAEIESHGFDNIATALSVSPAFLDQYVAAARLAARTAVGQAASRPSTATYAQTLEGDQPEHVDGLPLGTRGGMRFSHNFPADGEYRFTVLDLGVDLYARVLETRHTLVILIDGREVFRQAVGGPEDLKIVDRGGAPGRAEIMKRFTAIPVRVSAGTHDVAVAFIERARVESDEFVGFLPGDAFSRGDREPRVAGGVQVSGPSDVSGISNTISRQRIFICRPSRPDESQEQQCARRIAANLARRAFRRPVTDADIDSLMPHFTRGRQGGGAAAFDAGVEALVAAVLVSPDFLFRAIRTPQEAARSVSAANRAGSAGAPREFPLSDLELASRLSFFLWSQGPDETLLTLATAGKLRDTKVLQAQAARMLNDPRASVLVRNFALEWLDLDNLADVEPDRNLFPVFDEQLRRDMAAEIEAFVASILLENRSVTDLLVADHTFLNERLARHYGIRAVFGPQLRRVTLEDSRRRGLLGKAAVLLRTSYGDRTSPVLRGAWVMDKLMGTPPTPPPPDVESALSTPSGEAPKTLRARLESHRSKPGCLQCHGVIDPIGLALENFDAIGRWRDVDTDAMAPIDASTVLPNGRAVDGPTQLRDALFGGKDLFVRTLTEKLMMYAIGRELEYFDMPQVRAIVRQAAPDHRLPAIVSAIVASDAFRMQSRPPAEQQAGGTCAKGSPCF